MATARSVAALIDLDRVAGYVLSKRGSDGGYLSFQYMDMFESSAEDTFYALATLKVLGVDPPALKETVSFLRRLQAVDGGYRSVEVAYFSVMALALLGEKPRDTRGAAAFLRGALNAALREEEPALVVDSEGLIDERGVLRSKDATYLITPADMTPRLTRISMIVSAFGALGEDLGSDAEVAAQAILEQQSDGGFGYPEPQLELTFWAIEGLSALGRLDGRTEVSRWVLSCENEDGGFSANPHSRNYFVENLYFGLKALRELGSGPRYAWSHRRYVSRLQNANGGFRRAPSHGVSTLEYTFYAVSSMRLLGLL